MHINGQFQFKLFSFLITSKNTQTLYGDLYPGTYFAKQPANQE